MIMEQLSHILFKLDFYPPSFGQWKGLISARILPFPAATVLPTDPEAVYGAGWANRLRLAKATSARLTAR